MYSARNNFQSILSASKIHLNNPEIKKANFCNQNIPLCSPIEMNRESTYGIANNLERDTFQVITPKIDEPKRRAEVVEGQAVISTTTPATKEKPSYAEYEDINTGELKGLREGLYYLVEKDGTLIEHDLKDFSRTVTGQDGKIREMSQWNVNDGTTILTEDSEGNIKERTVSHWTEIKNVPQEMLSELNAINAVSAYNGTPEYTEDDIVKMVAKAIYCAA